MELFQRTSQLNENWNRAKLTISPSTRIRVCCTHDLSGHSESECASREIFSARLGNGCPFGACVGYVKRMGVSCPPVRDRTPELDGICINTEYTFIIPRNRWKLFAACVFVCRTRLAHIPKTGHGKGRIFIAIRTTSAAIWNHILNWRSKKISIQNGLTFVFLMRHSSGGTSSINWQVIIMHTRKTWFVQIHEWHQSKSVSPANTTAGIYSEFVFHV